MTHLEQAEQHAAATVAALGRSVLSSAPLRVAKDEAAKTLLSLKRHRRQMSPDEARRDAIRQAMARIEEGKAEAVGEIRERLLALYNRTPPASITTRHSPGVAGPAARQV